MTTDLSGAEAALKISLLAQSFAGQALANGTAASLMNSGGDTQAAALLIGEAKAYNAAALRLIDLAQELTRA